MHGVFKIPKLHFFDRDAILIVFPVNEDIFCFDVYLSQLMLPGWRAMWLTCMNNIVIMKLRESPKGIFEDFLYRLDRQIFP